MKVLLLKRHTLIYFIIIFLLLILVLIVYNKNKKINNNKDVEKNVIATPEELNENVEINIKEKDEFLVEQFNNKKMVAITFDDGPSKHTTKLVDELKKREIPATFFVLGSEIERFPDVLKFESDTGNEIGIHSYEHKLFTKLSEDEILKQVSKTKSIIENLTGITPNIIRVPYGSTNKSIKKVLNDHNLTSVLWSVDSLDWKFKNTEKTYNYVMKKFKGNDIILMHDSFDTSVEAAIQIVDTLQNQGYTFVTVSEFLRIKNLSK